MDDAWIEYQREQWATRTRVRRQRDKWITAELKRLGVKSFTSEDLAQLRKALYDPGPAGSQVVGYFQEDGILKGLQTMRFLTKEEKYRQFIEPLEKLRRQMASG